VLAVDDGAGPREAVGDAAVCADDPPQPAPTAHSASAASPADSAVRPVRIRSVA
jgi:hypothetical protein